MPMEANSQKNQQKHRIKLVQCQVVLVEPKLMINELCKRTKKLSSLFLDN